MIFVNCLAGVKGIPAWARHMPADADAMSFVDVVFPAFLFIVGMSIPAALHARAQRGDNLPTLRLHIFARAGALIVLGVFMVNTEDGFNEARMPISIHLWALLVYLCAFLIWGQARRLSDRGLPIRRAIGTLGLLVLFAVFRGGDGNQAMTPQWWGILGLIGWAYLIVSLIYLTVSDRLPILLGLMLGCSLYFVANRSAAIAGVPGLATLFSQFDAASDSGMLLAGLITALLFHGKPQAPLATPRWRAIVALLIAMLALGTLLRPAYGISKIHATPSWCLYSSAICVAVYAVVYRWVDVRGWQGWRPALAAVAEQPLLTYLIPFVIEEGMGYARLDWPAVFGEGWVGVLWSAAYTAIVVALARGLVQRGVRMKL